MGPIPKVYFCAYENCSAQFTRRKNWEHHQRTHTGERPFICVYDDCDKRYKTSSHLRRHEETHEINFRCSVEGCTEVLKTKGSLRKHLDYFHKQKKHKTYKCSLCEMEFNKHSWLQRHIVRHTGELPYVCPQEDCERKFLLPSRLKRHMQYHKGYHCKKDNCDQAFPKWSFLVKHMKECHPTVYKCDTCSKTFSGCSNLKRHKVVHQDEREVFECDFPNCSRFYTAKKNLNHHVKYFHGRRPFVCTKEHCHRSFRTEELLADHLLYHDSKKPRRKKKKSKPTLAAKLSGCAPPVVTNRWPASKATKEDEKATETIVKDQENTPDYITVTVTMDNEEEMSFSDGGEKSCLAIFEDILNNSFVPSEKET